MRADADIVKETLAGKRDAFSELVERHYPLVYGLALSSLRNRDDAEDAAQESFLRALKALNTLKEPARFASWLSSIVRNICRDFRARQSSEQHFANLAAETQDETAEPDGSELHELLWDHVMALPPDEREILILYYFSKHNTRAIAELLTISIPAAEKRLQRARQSLGTRMEAALNETMNQHRHRDRAVQQTALAVVACPVTWKTIGTPATGIAGTAASVLSWWKTIAALVAIGLIGGGYLLRDEFAAETPAVSVNAAAQETSNGDSSSDASKAETRVAKPAETKPGFFQVLANAIGHGPTGPTIHVVSKDDDSKTIEGAQIAIFNEEDPDNILKGTTGPDGNCVLSRVPQSGALLSVTHPDYLPQRRISIALKRSESQTVRLEPFDGILISGKVSAENSGQPITRFQLNVETETGELPARWRNGFVQFNDSGGRFEVNAGKSPNRLSAVAHGYAARVIDISKNDLDLNDLDIRLAPSYSVQLSVIDKKGSPIPGARVRVRPFLDLEDDSTKAWHTDELGRVQIVDLFQRPEVVVASHDDYVPEGVRLSEDATLHDLSETITLQKGARITGVVIRGSVPVSRASVSLERAEPSPNDQDQIRSFKRTQTDGDGRFELIQCPTGQFEIVSSMRNLTIRQFISVPEEGIENLALNFPSASDEGTARISGVVTIDGTPVASGHADLKVVSGPNVYTATVDLSSANSDRRGYFEIDDVMPGSAEIRFGVRNEAGLLLFKTVSLDIQPDKNTQSDVDIKTRAPLFVRVSGPANTDARVLVRVEGRQVASIDCEVGIETEIPGLEAGRYSLVAWTLATQANGGLARLADLGRAPEPGSEEAAFQSVPQSSEAPQANATNRYRNPNEVEVALKEGSPTRVELELPTER